MKYLIKKNIKGDVSEILKVVDECESAYIVTDLTLDGGNLLGYDKSEFESSCWTVEESLPTNDDQHA